MSLILNGVAIVLLQFLPDQGRHHEQACTELDAGEPDLKDDLGAPKWVLASSATPRTLAARVAVAHNSGAVTRGSDGDLSYDNA